MFDIVFLLLLGKEQFSEHPISDCEMSDIIYNSRFLRNLNEISYVKNLAYWLVHMGVQ